MVMLSHQGCKASDLTDGKFVPDDRNLICGSSYNVFSVKNGIVCYNSTMIGAIAFQLCLQCGLESLRPIRTCLVSGNWSGNILQCTCGKKTHIATL